MSAENSKTETGNLIQWPKAKYWTNTFNPYIGCHPASPACEHCYARGIEDRYQMNGGKGFEPTPHPKAKMPKSGIVFAGNLTDCFGEWLSYTEMDDFLKSMWRFDKLGARWINRNVKYLWLTKRPGRMGTAMANSEYSDTRHAYYGFTAENQWWYDRRMEGLLNSPCDTEGEVNHFNFWLSAEPLLGPLTIDPTFFSWVVVGSESGSERRPCKIEWIESIVEQCRKAGTPVFVKQLDINGVCERKIEKFPEHLRIRQVPWAMEVKI